MNKDFTLKEAVDFCESLGLVVFDKDKIKKFSFSFAERKDGFSDQPWLSKEELDKIHQEEAYKIIFEELKRSGFIHKLKRDDFEIDGVPTMEITTWSLRLLDV